MRDAGIEPAVSVPTVVIELDPALGEYVAEKRVSVADIPYPDNVVGVAVIVLHAWVCDRGALPARSLIRFVTWDSVIRIGEELTEVSLPLES